MGALAGPIIGAAGSVASGMLGGDDSGGSSTTTNEPWSALQPYLQQLYSGASNLLGSGNFPYYPGSTVAPRSPLTQASQQTSLDRLGEAGIFGQGYAPASNLMQSLMSQFNPALMGFNDFAGGGFGPSSTFAGNAAISSLMPTAQGDMLGSNPYLDSMFQGAASQVGDQFRTQTMPTLQSMFAQGGRYGANASMSNAVDLQNQGFGSTLNRLASNIYGGNYANERQNQMQAAGQLGALGTSDVEAQLRGLVGMQQAGQYDTQNLLQLLPMLMGAQNQDLGLMAGLGAGNEAYDQRMIDADKQRWDFMTQQSGYQPLSQFANLLGAIPTPSSGQTSTRAPQPDLMSSLFGGAMLGRSFQNQFFPQPQTSSYGLNSFALPGGTYGGMDSADYFSGF